MMDNFIIGVILGFFSCIGSITLAIAVSANIAEKRHREPCSKEDWRLH